MRGVCEGWAMRRRGRETVHLLETKIACGASDDVQEEGGELQLQTGSQDGRGALGGRDGGVSETEAYFRGFALGCMQAASMHAEHLVFAHLRPAEPTRRMVESSPSNCVGCGFWFRYEVCDFFSELCSHLRHCGSHQQDGGEHSHDGREGLDLLDGLRELVVEPHAEHDRDEHHLHGGDCHADRVHWDERAQEQLAQHGGHHDGADGGHGGHHHGEGHVAAGDVRAQVGRLGGRGEGGG